jgi:hypothetical protein
MENPVWYPNIEICKLVITPGFMDNKYQRNIYLQTYCRSDSNKWESYKQSIVKHKLNYCPDFVLPDTELIPDEIINKFDRENLN